MKITYKVVLPNADQLIKRFGLEQGGRMQKILDTQVVRYSQPYTPKDSGELERSVLPSIGSGLLKYDVPYAHRQWVGIKSNGEKFNYQHKNPLSDNRWVERAMADHLDDVVRVLEKELKNGR